MECFKTPPASSPSPFSRRAREREREKEREREREQEKGGGNRMRATDRHICLISFLKFANNHTGSSKGVPLPWQLPLPSYSREGARNLL